MTKHDGHLTLAKWPAVWEPSCIAVKQQNKICRQAGFVGAFIGVACAANGNYRVDAIFTLTTSQNAMTCLRASTTALVPELPVADRVLGDLVVQCERGCARDYALTVLLRSANQQGASHVSSLSCVKRGQGWCCVGRVSAPQHCETES